MKSSVPAVIPLSDDALMSINMTGTSQEKPLNLPRPARS
jgi:hypothetical protein